MAKLNVTKRIVTEDFAPEDQQLVEKLAFTMNSFFEQTAAALSKNITIEDNLNMEVKDVVVAVDGSGVPTSTTSFQCSLKTRVRGLLVIRAQNSTDATVFPSGAPLVSYSQNGSLITVSHITGLQAGYSFKLTILVLG